MISALNCISIGTLLLFLTVLQVSFASGQAALPPCSLAGAYRIDVEASDKLYSVVEGATSRVPFGDQQRFFMDLSTRLTPPDMIAIDCRGREVSIASSRSAKITFAADGVTKREARSGGTYVNSRVVLSTDKLIFTSYGNVEDDVNVTFQSVDGGQRMKVSRSISSEQLNEPIVITTFYDKFAQAVRWDNFDLAQTPRHAPQVAGRTAAADGDADRQSVAGEANVLRMALSDWIAATNRRDIGRQMTYYMPELKAYYLTRNTPRRAVLDEKRRVFKTARSIDISAEDPEIAFQDNGRTAVMRFHKKYRVSDKVRTRSGEVIQELRWQKTSSGSGASSANATFASSARASTAGPFCRASFAGHAAAAFFLHPKCRFHATLLADP